MLSTDGSSDMLGNISQVYGLGQTKELLHVEFEFNLTSSNEEEEEKEEENETKTTTDTK